MKNMEDKMFCNVYSKSEDQVNALIIGLGTLGGLALTAMANHPLPFIVVVVASVIITKI